MPAPAPRFHYIRLHNHPLGWGVRDAKHDALILLGDKHDCANFAVHLNLSAELRESRDAYYSPEHNNMWLDWKELC